ncbi:MAG: type II secretion system F family protein [Eubacteriales bacterium]
MTPSARCRWAPRRTALKEMADRCDVKELTVFVTSLLQADQLGVPIKSVLMRRSTRVERKQRIQAQARKALIKIMLPTVAFIFPVIFIILLGISGGQHDFIT